MAVSSYYWVFRFGGRDVLAAPCESAGIRAAAVRSIPAATVRSRLYRSMVRSAVGLGADRFFARRHFNPVPRFVGFDWAAFDILLREVVGRDAFQTAVIQPPQGGRNRFYVHLFSGDGYRFAFAKVSMDGQNDAQLRAEGEALSTGEIGNTFRRPRVLAVKTHQSRQVLLLESLPMRSWPAGPVWTKAVARVRQEIAGEPRALGAIQECSWWPEFVACHQQFGPLAEAVERDGAIDMTVCRAHGDFVNWNFHEDSDILWLFDWECYAPDAPVLTDEVRFLLGLHTRMAIKNPGALARHLYERYRCEDPHHRRDLFRALAFLHARDTTTATAVAIAWPGSCGHP
ncbi:MAG TPA: hypothetical protein VMT17_08105 [Anaeromyxobacteraceae bacterium]|nr:hypothetical protein [Anaeromyxobacteraceae bacterium]